MKFRFMFDLPSVVQEVRILPQTTRKSRTFASNSSFSFVMVSVGSWFKIFSDSPHIGVDC